MLARATTATPWGIEARPVQIEVDVHHGLPQVQIVGLADAAVRESRERVRAAIKNSGFDLDPRSIVINLAPADLRKEGNHLDLAIALAMLVAYEQLPQEALEGRLICGELGLDGAVRSVRGGLAIADLGRRLGAREVLLPAPNAPEAAALEAVPVVGLQGLAEAVHHLTGAGPLSPVSTQPFYGDATATIPDLSEVRGQEMAKRALEVAAAGGHNLLFLGPPGSGKTMLARRLPGILPPLSLAEAIAVTKVHSLVAEEPPAGLLRQRPFRSPHTGTSTAGMIGGGSNPRPGEASLAHNGVLFLDELPEFRRDTLEALRQPLEEGFVTVVRARARLAFPARFSLLAAMNPWGCVPFLLQVLGRKEGGEVYGDLLVRDGDALDDRLDYPPTLLEGQVPPAVVQILGFSYGAGGRQPLDGEKVHFRLEAHDLIGELGGARLKRLVPAGEAVHGHGVSEVQAVRLLHLGLDLLALVQKAPQEFLLGGERAVCLGEVSLDRLRGEEEVPKLFLEEAVEVGDRHLVAAAGPVADVLVRRGGGDVHLAPAAAHHHPGEKVDTALGRRLGGLAALVEDAVALVPELFGDDRLDLDPDPLVLGLELPVLLLAEGLGVVGAAAALGNGVADEALDRGVGEGGTIAGAVAGFGEEPGRGLEPLGLGEELVHAAPHRSLRGVRHELPVLPAVPKGGGAAERLAELCPDGYGSRHALSDLLALPLGEGAHDPEEVPAAWGRGINRLLEGDEIGLELPEDVGDLDELAGVAGQAGELGEDEAGYGTRADVVEHPASFWVAHDALAGDRFEPVHGDDSPSLHLGVQAAALLVVLGALAFGLLFGRDPDPDANLLFLSWKTGSVARHDPSCVVESKEYHGLRPYYAEPFLAQYLPAVIAFLGYHPDAESLGERIRTARRSLGITRRNLQRV